MCKIFFLLIFIIAVVRKLVIFLFPFILQGHKNWVLAVAWSPDGERLCSADKNGLIILWDPKTGKSTHKPLTGKMTILESWRCKMLTKFALLASE